MRLIAAGVLRWIRRTFDEAQRAANAARRAQTRDRTWQRTATRQPRAPEKARARAPTAARRAQTQVPPWTRRAQNARARCPPRAREAGTQDPRVVVLQTHACRSVLFRAHGAMTQVFRPCLRDHHALRVEETRPWLELPAAYLIPTPRAQAHLVALSGRSLLLPLQLRYPCASCR